ncbi:MAG: hypothetical protein IGS38_23910 [Synechococcales cyanobacterium M58_A2018_015]|nr:hypothetical protein [Synechococcales cyanobacterium M58_A2018_015]
MKSRCVFILSLALRSLLVNTLQKAANPPKKAAGLSTSENFTDLPPAVVALSLANPISLKRVAESTQIRYVSAIALQWAPRLQQPASQLAEQIAAQVQHFIADIAEPVALLEYPLIQRLLPHITVISAGGQIIVQVGAAGVAEWLQWLVTCPSELPDVISPAAACRSPLPTPLPRFSLLHAHARCCSLLQAAQREGWIQTVSEPELAPWLEPQPLPWLTTDGQLRCQQPEQQLIAALIDTVDGLAALESQLNASAHSPGRSTARVTAAKHSLRAWERQLEDLAQVFQQFHASCRLWGEVRREQPALALVRLGLVKATQVVLQVGLAAGFGVLAPREL